MRAESREKVGCRGSCRETCCGGRLEREPGEPAQGWCGSGDNLAGNGSVALVGIGGAQSRWGGSTRTNAPRAFVSVGVWAGRAPGDPGTEQGLPGTARCEKARIFPPLFCAPQVGPLKICAFSGWMWGAGTEAPWKQEFGSPCGPFFLGESVGSLRKPEGHGSSRNLAAGGLDSGRFSF